jgi:hypothetical protein
MESWLITFSVLVYIILLLCGAEYKNTRNFIQHNWIFKLGNWVLNITVLTFAITFCMCFIFALHSFINVVLNIN